MSQARTQDQRHWVYIELYPQGQVTGGMWIDLNMIDKVDFAFDSNPENPLDKRYCCSVIILYAGALKPIPIVNAPEINLNAAHWFHQYWVKYISGTLPADEPNQMSAAKPGLIHVPGKAGLKSVNN